MDKVLLCTVNDGRILIKELHLSNIPKKGSMIVSYHDNDENEIGFQVVREQYLNLGVFGNIKGPMWGVWLSEIGSKESVDILLSKGWFFDKAEK